MVKAKAKIIHTKEVDVLSMLLNGRKIIVVDRKEDDVFVSRAAFEGISACLFGATGKGDSVESARSMARRNLSGVFAGSMLHTGLLKEFKATNGIRNATLMNVCKPIFDNALAILGKPEYMCLVDSSRVFSINTDDELNCARAARKEIFTFARGIFQEYDAAMKAEQEANMMMPLVVQPTPFQLPPPPPPPNAIPTIDRMNGRNLKRTTVISLDEDEPSTSYAAPPMKKKKKVEVVEVKDDDDDDEDCVVIESSSESSVGDDEVFELATLGNTVNTPEKNGDDYVPANPYLSMADGYSEADLLGVTEWHGARVERRRVERYRGRFARELFTAFDEQIWQHYKSNGQDDNIYNWKMSVRSSLLEIAQKIFSGYSVNMFAVGSTINGCGSYNSDMDLCLVVYNKDGTITEGQDFARRYLNKVFSELKRRRDIVAKCQFIRHAVVPIIKMETVAPNSLEVDINMNNIAGVYNSHLMHYYSRVDDRFPALCLIVKHWAINAVINDSLCGTFNSYSLILLVLHYLQCGVFPAILPNLQYLYPSRFSERPELGDLNLFGEFTPPLPQRILNEQSVGEILIGFFQYYSRFDFNANAISIRKGTTFPRSVLPSETMKAPLYIEEPFDGKNTARCVRREFMSVIRAAFTHGVDAFLERAPRLKDIEVDV